MNEIMSEILDWYDKLSSPNEFRAYHRCPICSMSWWDEGLLNVERHSLNCWIPRLQNSIRELK